MVFRKRKSCQDHVFVLKNIIDIKLKEKKSIFACFVDFSSAYDYINRELMLLALKYIGIGGNFLDAVKQLLSNTEYSIKINDKITDWFQTTAGLRQGQND